MAQHYSRLAREFHPALPQDLSHLSWLDLSTEAGQEYWAAMDLMGGYAAANHALIHASITRSLGVDVMLDIENHHNFAWRERHRLPDGSEAEVIVHRKGATPAGAGVLGIIPGSMGTPGYVVRGKGVAASLNSAAHGAGRRMSRTKAKEMFTWDHAQKTSAWRAARRLSCRPRDSCDAGKHEPRRGQRARSCHAVIRANGFDDGTYPDSAIWHAAWNLTWHGAPGGLLTGEQR